jgi:alpha-beta hydrolase superfamily lysophospholipase
MLFVRGVWHGAWCGAAFVEFFSWEGFNAQARDLCCHGLKHAGPARLWCPVLGTYAKDVLREAGGFNTPPILIGDSLGCLLIEIAMAHIRPPAIVLLAPTRHDIFARSVQRFRSAHPREYARLLGGMTMWPPIETPALFREMMFSNALPEAELLDYHQLVQNESFWVAAQLQYGFGRRPGPALGIPTLVLGGELDRALLKEDVEKVAAYHGTSSEIRPGMGHDLMIDVGCDAVAKRIRDWIEGLGFSPADSYSDP